MKKTLKLALLLCLTALMMLLTASCGQLLGNLSGDRETTPAETTPENSFCSHSETQYIPAVERTCTQDGTTEGMKCLLCGEHLWAQCLIPAGHTEVIDERVEPTCTQTGLTEGSHCSMCGEVLIAQTEIPAKGHHYVLEIGDPREATVTLKYACDKDNCEDFYTEEITPVDFTITRENRQIIDSNLIEYRDPELVDGYVPLLEWQVATVTIPAVFLFFYVWYRVVAIDDEAFEQIIPHEVIIPITVTTIGDYIFWWWMSSGMTVIKFAGTMEQWEAIVQDSKWNYVGESVAPIEVQCSDGGFGYKDGISNRPQ